MGGAWRPQLRCRGQQGRWWLREAGLGVCSGGDEVWSGWGCALRGVKEASLWIAQRLWGKEKNHVVGVWNKGKHVKIPPDTHLVSANCNFYFWFLLLPLSLDHFWVRLLSVALGVNTVWSQSSLRPYLGGNRFACVTCYKQRTPENNLGSEPMLGDFVE